MSEERKGIAEMTAEALREMAVLLLIFAPLDFVFSDKQDRLTQAYVAAIVTVALALFVLGVWFERRRGS